MSVNILELLRLLDQKHTFNWSALLCGLRHSRVETGLCTCCLICSLLTGQLTICKNLLMMLRCCFQSSITADKKAQACFHGITYEWCKDREKEETSGSGISKDESHFKPHIGAVCWPDFSWRKGNVGFIFPFQSGTAIFTSSSCGAASVCVVIVPPAGLMHSFLTLGFATVMRAEWCKRRKILNTLLMEWQHPSLLYLTS